MWRTLSLEAHQLLQNQLKTSLLALRPILNKTNLTHCTCRTACSQPRSLDGFFQLPIHQCRQTVSSCLFLLNHFSTLSAPPPDGRGTDKPTRSQEPSSTGPATTSPGPSPAGPSPANVSPGPIAGPEKQKIVKVKKKAPLDFQYKENVYINDERALYEYMLAPSDLAVLPAFFRRNPYDSVQKEKILVYRVRDVEAKAIEVWGSLEKVKEQRRLISDNIKKYTEDLPMMGPDGKVVKSTYVNYKAEPPPGNNFRQFVQLGAGKVVLSAIFGNLINCLVKLVGWHYTGSDSLFAEFIHSVADTFNQVILAIGLYHSAKKPDQYHPYGYKSLKHITSLASGVGIFFLGTGVSVYHGVQGLLHPELFHFNFWAVTSLGIALVTEGASLVIALKQMILSSKEHKMKFREYVSRGVDPNINVVLLEDVAGVLGVVIATSCMAISYLTQNPFADSLGSLLIGGLLGGIAAFIINTNTTVLMGKSIPIEQLVDIRQHLESDRIIRSLHDVKATEMGGEIRFKAEIDFDGKELTRVYLELQDKEEMLKETQNLKTQEDLDKFLLKHGEALIDLMGAEIDRIEQSLKEKYPELRHVDLEAL
ncbi:hypothetical protein ACJMK2_030980 [Sinanodonta woodiana]|uniref:Proton-coupled zinc antiporter SLC30A9, mitochondrial n=1 Tax=Sinanodonta woodiana TaxID=1069815 RepID=A0ABD3WXG1_SINWO